MRFSIQRASWVPRDACPDACPCEEAIFVNDEWLIEINTLEDLMSLQRRIEHPLILDGNTLTIYDAFLE